MLYVVFCPVCSVKAYLASMSTYGMMSHVIFASDSMFLGITEQKHSGPGYLRNRRFFFLKWSHLISLNGERR